MEFLVKHLPEYVLAKRREGAELCSHCSQARIGVIFSNHLAPVSNPTASPADVSKLSSETAPHMHRSNLT